MWQVSATFVAGGDCKSYIRNVLMNRLLRGQCKMRQDFFMTGSIGGMARAVGGVSQSEHAHAAAWT